MLKRSMAGELLNCIRNLSKANRVPAKAPVETVDQRSKSARSFLFSEQIRLVMLGRDEIEQRHAHTQRFVGWNARPELFKPSEQE